MVLSTDLEVPTQGELLTVTTPTDPDVKRNELQSMTVPIPISVVRTYIDEFEEESLRRILLRYSGADVIPQGFRDGPESHGIKVVYGEVEGSDCYTLRTTGKLRVSAEIAVRVLVTPEMVPKFDEMTKNVRVLEKLTDATEVRLVSAKAVMFTSPRDFCVATTVRREASGRVIIATRSVDHPQGVQPGYVRALSMISGYIVTPDAVDPNVCEIAVIAHMNLGGSIPSSVIRYLGLSAPIKLVEKIREVTTAVARG